MRARMSRGATLAFTLAAALAAGCGGPSDTDSRTVDSMGAADQALAKAGAGQKPRQRDLCSGSPETIAGVVVGVGGGDGLTIETSSGTETVYGLGPAWYWSQNGVDRPVLGDSVEVVASHIITIEEEVILSITVNGQALQLRDPGTCTPLW
jgi:hypothetical protein